MVYCFQGISWGHTGANSRSVCTLTRNLSFYLSKSDVLAMTMEHADVGLATESVQEVDVTLFGSLTAAPLDPGEGWRALGPTEQATTNIFHRIDDPSEPDGNLVPGFVPDAPLIVKFPNLASDTRGSSVSVAVVGASNPFFALLIAKETLARHLRLPYEAEHDVLLCQGGAVSMGKLSTIEISELRDMSVEEVMRRGSEESRTLYHVTD